MQKLLNYLEKYGPTFQYAQVASAGRWETAVRLGTGKADDGSHQLAKTADRTVAGELMYKLNDSRIAFFGIRYSDSFTGVSSPAEFVEVFAHSAKLAQGNSFGTVLADISKKLTGDEGAFAESEVSFTEVGVIDNWQSVGSQVLPNGSKTELQKVLSQNRSLLKNEKNHVAVELAYKNPPFWVGIQVSEIVGDQYVTNLATLQQVLATI